MEETNLLSHWLFVFGPMILYLLIGILVQLTYGANVRNTKKEKVP